MSPTFHRDSRWCIVVADDQSADWAQPTTVAGRSGPVQYSRLGGTSCLVENALQRAAGIAPRHQIVVTALEEYRDWWEPISWAIPPRNKFVGDNRAAWLLTTTAALLAIAAKDPTHVVTILPARSHVDQEDILHAAVARATDLLPFVAEGALTLGMLDLHVGFDEDYLIVDPIDRAPLKEISRLARQPLSWVAQHLRERGAMVASGIVIGYAGAFAAHTSKHWPGLSGKLLKLAEAGNAASTECEVSMELQRGVPNRVLSALHWGFPFVRRAFAVSRCGWSSLKSPRAVERIGSFLSRTSNVSATGQLQLPVVSSANRQRQNG